MEPFWTIMYLVMSLRICTYRLNVNHENGIASRSRLAGCQQVMTKLWRIIQCSIPKSIVKISCVKSKSSLMMNLIYRPTLGRTYARILQLKSAIRIFRQKLLTNRDQIFRWTNRFLASLLGSSCKNDIISSEHSSVYVDPAPGVRSISFLTVSNCSWFIFSFGSTLSHIFYIS